MKIFDSHVHIAELCEIEKILATTKYKNKYKIYSAISLNAISQIKEYLKQLDGFYAIPFITKETDIVLANKRTKEFCDKFDKAIFVPLVEENREVSFKDDFFVFKEHFLIHNYLELEKRKEYYSFLNENRYFLIIHCKDRIRIKYIKQLRTLYPNMNIIIPHMGRDVYENYEFTKKVIDAFKSDEHIFFDTSTITNVDIIKYAIQKIGFDRISFGSDYPLGFNQATEVSVSFNLFNELKISAENLNKIFYDNALRRCMSGKI